MKRIFLSKSKKQAQQVETSSVVSDLSHETVSIADKVKAYLEDFLQPRVLKQRQSVYISQDVHVFITNIVKKLGTKNMTVGVFIDTVMTKHIREHADELKTIYYKKEGDIFKNLVKDNKDGGNL